MGIQFPTWGDIGNGLARLGEGMLSLVYPPRCAVCLKCEQAISCRFLCQNCLTRVLEAELPPVRPWQLTEETNPVSRTCACDLAAWFYEDSMMALVPRMKYQDRPALAKLLAGIAAERLREAVHTALFPPEKNSSFESVLLPVPLHPRRQMERGYNQSLLIARVLSAKWNIALVPRALRRVRFTQPQARLNAAERALNVSGVFAPAHPEKISGRTILLVDDVITTGATVSDCARALYQAGAERVIAVVLARTGRTPDFKQTGQHAGVSLCESEFQPSKNPKIKP